MGGYRGIWREAVWMCLRERKMGKFGYRGRGGGVFQDQEICMFV